MRRFFYLLMKVNKRGREGKRVAEEKMRRGGGGGLEQGTKRRTVRLGRVRGRAEHSEQIHKITWSVCLC